MKYLLIIFIITNLLSNECPIILNDNFVFNKTYTNVFKNGKYKKELSNTYTLFMKCKLFDTDVFYINIGKK